MRYCGRFIKVDLVKIVSVFGELSEGSCQSMEECGGDCYRRGDGGGLRVFR